MEETQRGVIVAFVVPDGLGRVRLEDGTEARFGMAAMKSVVPRVGANVRVGALVPHPLGGMRATAVIGTDASEAVDAFFLAARAAWEAARDVERARFLFAGEPAVVLDESARISVERCRETLRAWAGDDGRTSH